MDKPLLTTEDFHKTAPSTSVAWNGSMCDDCGVMAGYSATKDSLELNFCGHHVRVHAETLTSQGFSITPDNYSF